MSEFVNESHATKRKSVKPSDRILENALTAIEDLFAVTKPHSEPEWKILTEPTSALLLAAEEYIASSDFYAWADESEEPVCTMEHTLPFEKPSILRALVAVMDVEEVREKLWDVIQRLKTLTKTHMPQDNEIPKQASREG